jgi:hypothetical protein
MIGSIFGSSPTAQNGQAMVGFNTDGTLKYGDVGAFFRTGNNISYTGGNVGIGITNPAYKLSVTGDTSISGKLYLGDTSKDYTPSGANWNYTIQLNGLDTTSIGFHDAGNNV